MSKYQTLKSQWLGEAGVDETFAGLTWPRLAPRPLLKSHQERYDRYAKPSFVGPLYSFFHLVSKKDEFTGFYLGSKTGGMPFDLRIEAIHDQPFDSSYSPGHTGWFMDNHQHQTVFGIIAKLPGNKGFLAGHSMGEGTASALCRDTVYKDAYSAASAADDIAKYYAFQALDEDYQDSDAA